MILFISLMPFAWGLALHRPFRPFCGWTAQTPEPSEAYEIVHMGKHKGILFDLSPYRVELPKRQNAMLVMVNVI